MAHSEFKVMSDPAEVIFAGFVSDTRRLQQAGWRLSMNQDVYGRLIQLAMHHPGAGLYMVADAMDFEFMRPRQYSHVHGGFEPPPRFVIRHCSSKIVCQVMANFANFRPVDAEPQYVEVQHKNIEDFNIFASSLVRTEEIIVEPQSVAECLELIRKMQAPDLAEVRKRNARRDQPIEQQNFHAQIISLAA